MSLYRRFNPLRLYTDVALGNCGAAVLQEPLHKGDIITVILVNLGRVPLTEAVCANPIVAQVVADDGKLLLYRSFGNRKDKVFASNAATQTVVFYVLLDDQRNGENAAGVILQVDGIKLLFALSRLACSATSFMRSTRYVRISLVPSSKANR